MPGWGRMEGEPAGSEPEGQDLVRTWILWSGLSVGPTEPSFRWGILEDVRGVNSLLAFEDWFGLGGRLGWGVGTRSASCERRMSLSPRPSTVGSSSAHRSQSSPESECEGVGNLFRGQLDPGLLVLGERVGAGVDIFRWTGTFCSCGGLGAGVVFDGISWDTGTPKWTISSQCAANGRLNFDSPNNPEFSDRTRF